MSGPYRTSPPLPPCALEDSSCPSRRELLGAVGAGLALTLLPGCQRAIGRLSTGVFDDPNPTSGLGGQRPPGPGDTGGGDGHCTKAAVNLGKVDLAMGSFQRFNGAGYDFYLGRDVGGLYALSALCTHAAQVVKPQGQQFYCAQHGAFFDANGEHPTAPALTPLPHFAVCIGDDGGILVDSSVTVAAKSRTAPNSNPTSDGGSADGSSGMPSDLSLNQGTD